MDWPARMVVLVFMSSSFPPGTLHQVTRETGAAEITASGALEERLPGDRGRALFLKLERRRTDSSIYTLRAGCGSVNCVNDFGISHSTAGTCIAIRDGCDVDIPKLEVDTFRSNPTDSPGSCNGTTEGRFYYDASLDEPCFCNGSDWRQFDGGGTC